MLIIFTASLLCSFTVSLLLIRYSHLHSHLTADADTDGVQKFHASPVPRIGGVPIFVGLVVGSALFAWISSNKLPILLLISALPAFGAGLLEDTTKKIGPVIRLMATFLAALLAYVVFHVGVVRLDITLFDLLLSTYWPLSLLVTVVAVGGVAHAVNIIDGYNGLSAVVAILVFIAFSYVCFKVQDSALMAVCFTAIGAIAGFLFWNFPRGMIFAGDGGAYLVGFVLAEISVLLVARHPEVSAWFPLLCLIYPIFETLYSIYRKKFLRGMSPGVPDGLHLHMLIYKRLVLWMVGSKDAVHRTQRNSLTSPYLWAVSGCSVVPAMLFWNHTYVLMACVLAFGLSYIYLYRMIVRFKTPRWMVLRRDDSSR